jgi:hypothetical protein
MLPRFLGSWRIIIKNLPPGSYIINRSVNEYSVNL